LSFGAKLITRKELANWWGDNICQYFVSKFTKGADLWANPDCINNVRGARDIAKISKLFFH